MKQLLLAIIPFLMVATVSDVYAGGPRLDSGDDATDEEHDCWVDGFDSGFAGKYDSVRARECIEHDDNYNGMWAFGCEESTRTEAECNEIMNNPVEIEDFEALYDENKSDCYYAGIDEGKASNVSNAYNKVRADGCSEFGSRYKEGFQFGCETHTTQASCELLISGEKSYCPWHPDIAGCRDFLHNATNKITRQSSTDAVCALENVTCLHESNPERYCLNWDDPTFCKTIGDLCDEDGFVKPEYPYCTEQVK
jgi:hypothetical protein